MNLVTWAIKWGVPAAAVEDLRAELGMNGQPDHDEPVIGKSEAWADSQIMLEAPHKGVWLWRNNVGALPDRHGRLVRYGLANDSERMNEKLKSGDRIGIRPVPITRAHVGLTIGQFVSREIKKPGWHYTGKDGEPQQMAWATFIASLGGDAAFATGAGTL